MAVTEIEITTTRVTRVRMGEDSLAGMVAPQASEQRGKATWIPIISWIVAIAREFAK